MFPDENERVGHATRRAALHSGLVLGVLLCPAVAPAAESFDAAPGGHRRDSRCSTRGNRTKHSDLFRGIETAQPDHLLLGYLLEAEARWWKIYCETCEIKWNMIDAWPQPRRAADDSYLVLSEEVTRLAEARIAKNDSAEMELYAGLGWLLRAPAGLAQRA